MVTKISIIGCGRVGTALGVYLSRAGYAPACFYSRTRASAQRTCITVGSGTVAESPEEAVKTADVVFVTTPDDAIEAVSSSLAGGAPDLWLGKTVFHCSGALSSALLSSARDQGAETGSFHPLQSFAPYEDGQKDPFQGINISIEGSSGAVSVGTSMIERLGARWFEIPTDAKTLYHAAAVVASNYLVTLERFALDLLGEAGLNEKDAFQILEPLIQGTLANIKTRGTTAALTGPVARGDSAIIRRHMDDMANRKPEYLDLYRLLGRYTLAVARASGNLGDPAVRSMERLFSGQGNE